MKIKKWLCYIAYKIVEKLVDKLLKIMQMHKFKDNEKIEILYNYIVLILDNLATIIFV